MSSTHINVEYPSKDYLNIGTSRNNDNGTAKRTAPLKVIYLSDSDSEEELSDEDSAEVEEAPRPRQKRSEPVRTGSRSLNATVIELSDCSSDEDFGDDLKITRTPMNHISTPANAETPKDTSSLDTIATKCTPSRGLGTTASPEVLPAALSQVSQDRSLNSRQKKKAQEARSTALVDYAQRWFDDVNFRVFGNRLLVDTELIWNKRFIATAGRAQYKRDRHGVETSSIQLAVKILVNEERIRNTLSHEMCHLACWKINDDQKEQHGKAFKAWAQQIMAVYPEVVITTRHDYEIEHPYNWKCVGCGQTYGRFSNSIKIDQVGCGVCNGSRLVPLFDTPQKRIKEVQMSRLAAKKPRDSPRRRAIEIADSDTDPLIEGDINRLASKLAETRLEST